MRKVKGFLGGRDRCKEREVRGEFGGRVSITLAAALLDGNTSVVQNTFLMLHLSGLDACLKASKEIISNFV